MESERGTTETRTTAAPGRRAAAPVAIALAAMAATAGMAATAAAQTPDADAPAARSDTAGPTVAPGTLAEWTYPVGEEAIYDVRVAMGRVSAPRPLGEARLAVEARERVDGSNAYRLALEIEGGVPMLYRQNDRQVSWVTTDPMRTLRFEEHLRQGDYRRDRLCRMDQEAHSYSCFRQGEGGEWAPIGDLQDRPMPEAAVDEVAILYLVRGLPLGVGETYRFDRLFERDSNPVRIEVLRRETVRVPAGRFETIVVRPVFRSGGLFGEEGRAEVFLADDERRAIVKIESSMRLGRIDLLLKEYRAPDDALADG